MQKVIIEEDLLAQCRKNGDHMLMLLKERLQSPNALAAPYIFDVRGAGAFFGIEFEFSDLEARRIDMKGHQFAMVAQACCFKNGLVAMGMVGGSTLDGSKGDVLILGPAYNATTEEIEKIVDIFVRSIEEVLTENFA